MLPADADETPGVVGRQPQKKALLIGITYFDSPCKEQWQYLRCARPDVLTLKDLLLRKYGYEDMNVITLLDGNDDCPEYFPSEDHLIREIRRLVEAAIEGDEFLFYYSGHGHQVPSEHDDEEDFHDECIVSYEGKLISDNFLKSSLVDPLPLGSRLVAIFDCCHAGTMLDLKHYHCNKAWDWKQKRLSLMGGRKPRRRDAADIAGFDKPPSRQHSISIDVIRSNPAAQDFLASPLLTATHGRAPERASSIMSVLNLDMTPQAHWPNPNLVDSPPLAAAGARSPERQSSIMSVLNLGINSPVIRSNAEAPTNRPPSPLASNPRTPERSSSLKSVASSTSLDSATSLVGWFNYPGMERAFSPVLPKGSLGTCTGETPPGSPTLIPEVVSFSSCMDSQTTLEGDGGGFFSQALLSVLGRDGHLSYRELMQEINKQLQGQIVKMKEDIIRFGKELNIQRSDSDPEPGYQLPMLGSQKTLNMDSIFCL
ncbi:hypothetical protein JAAARDRAFT_335244 [Jaapia argillacea MUCL 33604]|uniref:Peptidase C14 caspase domain-containing protein n=1 Tax=Jaapia argillacea MUCL 33604 TaxID=933084 RepID=A0A067PNL0_9AGAM|nr:hypothetical protein JAAARDRAFT_335244 [Jaapia argillacea MUCL 33604]